MGLGKYTIKNIYDIIQNYDLEVSCPIIIDGYLTKYFVTTKGRVYKISKDYFIEYIHSNVDESGYHRIQIYYRNNKNHKKRAHIMLHRLVAMAFIPNPNDLEDVNHKDGNKSNNKLDNLEWCTHSENMIHSYKNNLHKSGEENSQHIYITEQIRNVCKLLSENSKSISEISLITGVSTYTISDIKDNKKWKNISKDYDISKHSVKSINTGSATKYSDEQIIKVCELLESKNNTLHEISLLTKVGFNTIADIKRKRIWTRISNNYNF